MQVNTKSSRSHKLVWVKLDRPKDNILTVTNLLKNGSIDLLPAKDCDCKLPIITGVCLMSPLYQNPIQLNDHVGFCTAKGILAVILASCNRAWPKFLS